MLRLTRKTAIIIAAGIVIVMACFIALKWVEQKESREWQLFVADIDRCLDRQLEDMRKASTMPGDITVSQSKEMDINHYSRAIHTGYGRKQDIALHPDNTICGINITITMPFRYSRSVAFVSVHASDNDETRRLVDIISDICKKDNAALIINYFPKHEPMTSKVGAIQSDSPVNIAR